ncbi:MAG: Dabb family protein [Ruminococcaceae bacterium]|nr:Dabb family protein [Oscillospiraceae bacterium]
MLRHIVMWKFTDGEGHTKEENIDIAKKGLEALPDKVPTLKKITFIKNEVKCDRNFDGLLIVETQNEEDLEAYKTHPEHVKVAEFIGKVTVSRGAVDYYE